MFTVLSWYAARRSRRSLHELVLRDLTATPTLIAVVSDRYTTETNIRPFHFLAERLGDRMHVLVAAEWPQADREREGGLLLRQLGLPEEHHAKLLGDEGEARSAVIVRARQPIGIIELFFEERGLPLDPERLPSQAELRTREREAVALEALERLLVRLPRQPPPLPAQPAAPRPPWAPGAIAAPPGAAAPQQQPGAHDFAPGAGGLCRQCGDKRGSQRACPGRDEGPRRDRFELIELD